MVWTLRAIVWTLRAIVWTLRASRSARRGPQLIVSGSDDGTSKLFAPPRYCGFPLKRPRRRVNESDRFSMPVIADV
eukprot:1187081-Prorocentrum_minimum.AAC.1